MVLCSVCKNTKDPKVNWTIQEHSVDNSVLHSFKICDECAGKLLRQIATDMKLPVSTDEMLLNYTGLIGDITLNAENNLEVILQMDLAKARKAVMDKIDCSLEDTKSSQ